LTRIIYAMLTKGEVYAEKGIEEFEARRTTGKSVPCAARTLVWD
jgi:hypothetical protein